MIELLAGTAFRHRLAAADGDDLFTSAAWLGLIADAYGIEIRAACDSDAGDLLPFAVLDDFCGRRLISLPFSDYLTFGGAPDRLFDLAEAVLAGLPAFAMTIRLAGSLPGGDRPGWSVVASGVRHRVMPAGEAALRQLLSASFRNQLRQAERHGVAVQADRSPAAIERFYELHAALRNRKFTSLPQPRRFFRLIHERFIAKGCGFVLEARYENAVVAACVALRHRGTLYYKFSASAPAAERLRANNLMLWELLRHAAADGLALDLGRSGCGPEYAGLRHFKGGLGATAEPIATLGHPPLVPDAAALARAEEFVTLGQQLARLLAAAGLDADGNDAAAQLLYRYFA